MKRARSVGASCVAASVAAPPRRVPAQSELPAHTLPSGQRLYGKEGLPPQQLAAVPTKKLAPGHFGASPLELPGAPESLASMPKNAIKTALTELQWAKLAREKDARRAARPPPPELAPAPPPLAADVAADADAAPRPLVVIDCGGLAIDALMSPAENCSLSLQVAYAYAAVRRRAAPCRLAIVGITDARAQQLQRGAGAAQWRLAATRASLEDLLAARAAPALGLPAVSGCGVGREAVPLLPTETGSIVYLSSDAPGQPLLRLDPRFVYIVGGLVDRNRHKGLALARAAALGLSAARLPLEESVGSSALGQIHRRRVLTTSSCVAILAAVCDRQRVRQAAEPEGVGASAGCNETAQLQLWRDAILEEMCVDAGAADGGAASDGIAAAPVAPELAPEQSQSR